MIHRRHFLTGAGAGLAGLLMDRREIAAAIARLGGSGASADFGRARDEYMLRPGLLYLNHGSIGTIPRAVHDAHVRRLAECESNPHVHLWEDVWTEALAGTRAAAAALTGSTAGEVALTHNTTEGFNVLAQGLPLGQGDEVLFSSLNHQSASEPWRYYAARRGFTVRQFTIPLDGLSGLSARDLVALHAREIRPETRVLVFPHVDNIIGVRHPIRELVAAARAGGVQFVAVDIAQSLGMLPVDAAAEGADFYAASPHKWVQAPKGLGLLIVRANVRERLDPLWVKRPRAAMPATAEVFEDYSTRNLPAVLALADAIAFQTRLADGGAVARRLELARAFRDRVDAAQELEWRSPRAPELASSLFAVGLRRADARTAERRLAAEHGIVVRPFGPPLNTLRVSPNIINTESDADRLIAALASA